MPHPQRPAAAPFQPKPGPIAVYFSPKGGCAAAVVAALNSATRTLDVAIFSLTHDDITNALIAAHQRGVAMRVVVDASEAKGAWSDHPKLVAAGIDVRISVTPGLTHDKIAVIDAGLPSAALVTGSFNWTTNADHENTENLLVVALPDVVTQYATQYETIWTLNAPRAPKPAAPSAPAS